MAHSPGPWIVDETKALGAYGVWTDYTTHPGHDGEGYGSQICSMIPERRKDKDTRNADARLIAAAPDLLKELAHLVRLLEPLEADALLQVPGLLSTLNGARAAITKASGS